VVQIEYIAKQSVTAASGAGAVVESMGAQVLTCVRVLLRVLPVVFQSGGASALAAAAAAGAASASRSFEETVLWRNETPRRNRGAASSTPIAGRALALTLVCALRRLCFVPNFTIDSDVFKASRRLQVRRAHEREVWGEGLDDGSHDEQAAASILLWSPGASNGTVAFSDAESLENLAATQRARVYDVNRIEVLRLICLCCSKTLYCGAAELSELAAHGEWLRAATDADAAAAADEEDADPDGKAPRFMGSRAATSALFLSLINTALGFKPRETGGWGSSVPYWGAMGAETPRAGLVDTALHTLLVLLDAKPKKAAVAGAAIDFASEFDEPNMWVQQLAAIEGMENHSFIYRNVTRLLNGVHASVNTFLPNSVRCMRCHTEVLLLLWKTIETNPAFLRHITSENEDVTEIIIPLCFFLSRCRTHASMLGVVHVCTFLLLRLSSERQFSVALNRTLKTRLPLDDLPALPKEATHADLMIVVIHQVVTDGHPRLRALHPKLCAVLANVSAFVTDVAKPAAIKLVDLLDRFAAPLCKHAETAELTMAANPDAKLIWPPMMSVYCDCARLLIETLNNLLQYQFRGSTYVVYCAFSSLPLYSLSRSTLAPSLTRAIVTSSSSSPYLQQACCAIRKASARLSHAPQRLGRARTRVATRRGLAVGSLSSRRCRLRCWESCSRISHRACTGSARRSASKRSRVRTAQWSACYQCRIQF